MRRKYFTSASEDESPFPAQGLILFVSPDTIASIMSNCRIHVKPSRLGNAFTLLELLIVMVLIAILVGILLAALNGVRKAGDRAKCVSNLRQVGTAIGAYVADHDGSLPGALWTSQSSWYNSTDYGSLGNVLSRYLNLNLILSGGGKGNKSQALILVCPAWRRGVPYQEDDEWVMNTQVSVNGVNINPWGYADIVEQNGNVAGLDPNGLDMPRKIASLTGVSLSTTWAMQDLDKRLALQLQQSGVTWGKTWYGIVTKPVHSNVRNALFFDFHVAAIPVPANQQN
jgi:prepilin-type N-terminal cleavage/methylation domain-containing protein/prepilin-type processing-associated H-X9-DG protein